MNIETLSALDCDNLKMEIALHSKLEHPNIIRFYDSLQIDNTVYFLLEYAQGNSLFFYINGSEGLPERLALRFFYFTAQAIKYLHDHLIMHRDIKPENILVDEQFNVKLCDFGWSSQLRSEHDFKTSVCGTYEYMSPEIMDQVTHSFKADIWGLGILLIELLTGSPPYKAHSLSEIRYQFKTRPIQISTKYAKETRSLIRQMLKVRDEDRLTIDQVLAHEAFDGLKENFTRPVPADDAAELRKCFARNISDFETQRVETSRVLQYAPPPASAPVELSSPAKTLTPSRHLFAATPEPLSRNGTLPNESFCSEDLPHPPPPPAPSTESPIKSSQLLTNPQMLRNAIDHLIYKGEYDKDVEEPNPSRVVGESAVMRVETSSAFYAPAPGPAHSPEIHPQTRIEESPPFGESDIAETLQELVDHKKFLQDQLRLIDEKIDRKIVQLRKNTVRTVERVQVTVRLPPLAEPPTFENKSEMLVFESAREQGNRDALAETRESQTLAFQKRIDYCSPQRLQHPAYVLRGEGERESSPRRAHQDTPDFGTSHKACEPGMIGPVSLPPVATLERIKTPPMTGTKAASRPQSPKPLPRIPQPQDCSVSPEVETNSSPPALAERDQNKSGSCQTNQVTVSSASELKSQHNLDQRASATEKKSLERFQVEVKGSTTSLQQPKLSEHSEDCSATKALLQKQAEYAQAEQEEPGKALVAKTGGKVSNSRKLFEYFGKKELPKLANKSGTKKLFKVVPRGLEGVPLKAGERGAKPGFQKSNTMMLLLSPKPKPLSHPTSIVRSFGLPKATINEQRLHERLGGVASATKGESGMPYSESSINFTNMKAASARQSPATFSPVEEKPVRKTSRISLADVDKLINSCK